MVDHAYSLSYSGGWGATIARAPEVEAVVSHDHATALQPGQQSKLFSLKKKLERKKKFVVSFYFKECSLKNVSGGMGFRDGVGGLCLIMLPRLDS